MACVSMLTLWLLVIWKFLKLLGVIVRCGKKARSISIGWTERDSSLSTYKIFLENRQSDGCPKKIKIRETTAQPSHCSSIQIDDELS